MPDSYIASRAFHALTVRDYRQELGEDASADFDRCYQKMRLYFQRLGVPVPIEGKSVLDVGCGYGGGCLWLAEHGARPVVGVDIDERRVRFASATLATQRPREAARTSFALSSDLNAMRDGCFDVILSKDSFEHYADPARTVQRMRDLLGPGGLLCIGFGPLWKSPYGGHIGYMTRFPWAHLLFPESVILRERKRFRPGESPSRWEDIVGGLNRMTLARFNAIMRESRLECVSLRTNASEHGWTGLARSMSKLPGLREYLTFNVYSVWRRVQ